MILNIQNFLKVKNILEKTKFASITFLLRPSIIVVYELIYRNTILIEKNLINYLKLRNLGLKFSLF